METEIGDNSRDSGSRAGFFFLSDLCTYSGCGAAGRKEGGGGGGGRHMIHTDIEAPRLAARCICPGRSTPQRGWGRIRRGCAGGGGTSPPRIVRGCVFRASFTVPSPLGPVQYDSQKMASHSIPL